MRNIISFPRAYTHLSAFEDADDIVWREHFAKQHRRAVAQRVLALGASFLLMVGLFILMARAI